MNKVVFCGILSAMLCVIFCMSAFAASMEPAIGVEETHKEVRVHYSLNITVTINESDVVVKWNSVEGATEYKVAVDRLGETSTYTVQKPAIRLTKLGSNKDYGIRVKYITPNEEGPWVAYHFNTDEFNINTEGLPLPTVQDSDATYCILVIKGAQITAVYTKGDDGAYSKLVRTMICSTGLTSSRTPTGYYSIVKKEVWHHWGSNNYSIFNMDFNNTLKLHSILFKGKSIDSPLSSIEKKLGTPASAGCVRLQLEDARWIYENCPVGTPIEIIEGEAMPELLTELKRW